MEDDLKESDFLNKKTEFLKNCRTIINNYISGDFDVSFMRKDCYVKSQNGSNILKSCVFASFHCYDQGVLFKVYSQPVRLDMNCDDHESIAMRLLAIDILMLLAKDLDKIQQSDLDKLTDTPKNES